MSAPLVLAVDVVCVVVFAALGRASHEESGAVLGVLATAWPFLTGLLVGWAWVLRRAGAAPRTVRAAVPVWLATLAGGMLLRAATGSGVAVSFVLVAAAFLALFLLGWRAVAGWLLGRRRQAEQTRAPAR